MPLKKSYNLGDVIYKAVTHNIYIMPVYRVTSVFYKSSKPQSVKITDMFGKESTETVAWLNKIFISYEQMCADAVDNSRAGFPYERKYDLIVLKDKFENPEEYL